MFVHLTPSFYKWMALQNWIYQSMNWYKTLPLSLKWRWGADLTEKVVLHKHCRLMDLSAPLQPFTLRWRDIVNFRTHPDWKHNNLVCFMHGPGLEGSAGGIQTTQNIIHRGSVTSVKQDVCTEPNWYKSEPVYPVAVWQMVQRYLLLPPDYRAALLPRLSWNLETWNI